MSELSQPVEVSERTPEKKRTVREFLRQYRALGLPGAKRFRRRTRLEQARFQHNVDVGVVRALIGQLGAHKRAFDQLKDENNWVVRESGSADHSEVIWVGESDPLEIIREAEKAASKALPQSTPPSR